MNLRHKNLKFTFLASLIAMALFSFRLHFFAPFLIICYYQKSFPTALRASLLCGILIDLFTSPLKFGLHALNYTLTTALIYHQKKNLFADHLTTLPLMTSLFSFLSTLIQIFLLALFLQPIPLTFSFIFTDLLFMPAIDGLFAFCWFILPNLIFQKQIRHQV